MFLKQQNKNNKLASKYCGPYKVVQMIGSVGYKLDFPSSSCVHIVFHVYCLKMVIGNKIPFYTILLYID